MHKEVKKSSKSVRGYIKRPDFASDRRISSTTAFTVPPSLTVTGGFAVCRGSFSAVLDGLDHMEVGQLIRRHALDSTLLPQTRHWLLLLDSMPASSAKPHMPPLDADYLICRKCFNAF
ncbi:hypothetical protein AB1N83_010033 [Pleurotus pulmonarius]